MSERERKGLAGHAPNTSSINIDLAAHCCPLQRQSPIFLLSSADIYRNTNRGTSSVISKIIMLSSIGRSAIRRVVAGASQPSTTRVFQSVWHLQAAGVSKSTDNALSHTQVSFEFRRFLATATKAPRASKTSAESKPKTSVKKAKDKAAAKPKTKGRPKKKKVVTPEEKAKREVQKLKALVLSPPKLKPTSAWKVLFSELSVPGQAVSVYAKNVAEKYKSLSPGELEVCQQSRRCFVIVADKLIPRHTITQPTRTRRRTKLLSSSGSRVTHLNRFGSPTMRGCS